MSDAIVVKKPGTLGRLFRTFRRVPKVRRAGDAGPLTEGELAEWITARVAHVLEIEPAQLDRTRPLSEFGLDSRAAVTLAGDLERWLGRQIDVTLAWDHPTIDGMAAHLAAHTPPGATA